MKSWILAALGAACAFVSPVAASAQTIIYRDTGTTGLSASAPGTAFLQVLTPIGTGSYTLSAMTFGVGVAAGTTAQNAAAFFDFYSNVNTSPTAADALVGATYLGGYGVNLPVTANTTGTTAYRSFNANLNTLSTPIVLSGSSTIGVVGTFTDATGAFYSTILSGLFTTAAPTVGTAAGYVVVDSNQNGAFAGSERVAGANAYLQLTGIAAITAVPEPATWGMMILGFGMVGGAMRRRQATTRVLFAA